MLNDILIGYEVKTGKPVYMELAHTVVTGQTQKSGKTTTLEAIITRSGKRAVAFNTKRGESGFQNSHMIPAYFKERQILESGQIDWQYVEGILEATMKQRMKFERSWIINACKGAKNLEEVYNNIKQSKGKAKRGIDQSVYTNLEAYFEIVIPEMHRFTFSSHPEIEEGVNVMDLIGMSEQMAALVIQATMEYIITKMRDVVVIIPEAWKFLPQRRSTPVKWFAERFIREGASISNYLFIDSQDLSGVDKTILKQCYNWIMGRQREYNEVKRVRDTLGKEIKPELIRTLPIGHFIAALGDDLKHIYVLPSWLSPEKGIQVAKGELDVAMIEAPEREDQPYHPLPQPDETNEELREENELLRVEIKEWVKAAEEQEDLRRKAEAELADLQDQLEEYENLRTALGSFIGTTPKEAPRETSRISIPTEVNINHKITSIEVTHEIKTVEYDTESLIGKIALLYVQGELNEGWLTLSTLKKLFEPRGWGWSNKTGKEALQELTTIGFFTVGKAGNRPQWRVKIPPDEAQNKGLLKFKEVKT